MSPSKKPQFTLNLGDLDATVRITSTIPTTQDSGIAESRAGAVKRYKGYLHKSIRAGFSPVLANADYRSLNIAFGHQATPSMRTRRLLKALPRLDTGQEQSPVVAIEEDYFSLAGGWELYVQEPQPDLCMPPPLSYADRVRRNAERGEFFDWFAALQEENAHVRRATDRYKAFKKLNPRPMGRESRADRFAREARSAEYNYSLLRERGIICRAECLLITTRLPDYMLGLVPLCDEWRHRPYQQAIAQMLAERRWREKWAAMYPDTCHLLMS